MNSKEIHIITPRFDSFGLRNTNNDITDVIQYGNLTQIYKGPIVRGCYHGKGLIIWMKKNQKKIFEGYFYVNQIHGYGRLTYENGLIFEGLYKHNMRFGPGVVTYPNQHQEVGFWVGNHILRLSCNLTNHTVPSYDASNVYTKIKLLQFKHFIDLTKPPHSIINIQDNNEKYLNEKYSFPFIRHSNSLFFDNQAFDHEFILNSMKLKNYKEIVDENRFKSGNNLQDLILNNYLKISKETSRSNKEFLMNCGINIDKQFELLNSKAWIIKQKEHKNVELENLKLDSIHSSSILTYNNNTLDKMMLAHAYHHRFGEASLLYNLNNIWNEKRSMFMPSQSQESGVVRLLSKLDISPENIKNLITNYNIDSDAADSRGNTRLMISSANDQHEIIKCMINLGASIECYNDDGFTPLNLTLMRYICLLNDIKHWNEYLIPHVNLKFNIKKGHQDITLENVQEINFFHPENFLNMKVIEKNVKIEDMNSTSKQVFKTKKSILLDSAQNTIELLINEGAKATTCIVPKPSIHLALMTMNPTILKAVFKAGGSPSYTLSNENFKLNLLHMAVIMPTNGSIIKCIEVLILHHVDPNSKALPMFNIFRYQFPWIKITNDKAKATMTPLDVFCLKKNEYKLNGKYVIDEQSENKLASILYDITEKSNTYCGFKPIALAMLSGKLNLTEIFLNKDKKMINRTISGFGTLLTLLINPNYNFNLSHKMINELLDLLLKSNSNPLKIVKISDQKFSGNIYEYCYVLSESEKLQDQEKYVSNYTEIVEKLENAGRTILSIIYAKRAEDALLKMYKNRKTSSFSLNKTALLLWLDFELKTKIQKVKTEKISNYKPFNFKIVDNFNPLSIKKKIKKETHAIDFQQIKKNSKISNQFYLTQEEILVCYECLKHSSNKMETCSICYFALLCSENCKRQHKKKRCNKQIIQRRLINLQNKINKNDVTLKKLIETKSYSPSAHLISTEKSYRQLRNKSTSSSYISMRPSSLLLLQSSKMSPSLLIMKSDLSIFSKKSNHSLTNFSNNNLHQSQKKIMDDTDTQKYEVNNNVEDQLNHSNLNQIYHSTSTIHNTNTDSISYNVRQSQKKIIDVTHTQKYEENNNLDNQPSHSNFIQIHHSVSSMHNTNTFINDKNGLNLYNRDLFNYNTVTYLYKSRLLKNKPREKLKKSTVFMMKWRNHYKKNNWKLKQKTQNQETNCILCNQLSGVFIYSIKYKMVRFTGCKRPIFMFIDRNNNEDRTSS